MTLVPAEKNTGSLSKVFYLRIRSRYVPKVTMYLSLTFMFPTLLRTWMTIKRTRETLASYDEKSLS